MPTGFTPYLQLIHVLMNCSGRTNEYATFKMQSDIWVTATPIHLSASQIEPKLDTRKEQFFIQRPYE